MYFAPSENIFWVLNLTIIWEFNEAVDISSSQTSNRWSRIYLDRLKMLESLEIDLDISSWFDIEFKSIKDVKAEFEKVKNLKFSRKWDNLFILLLTAIINSEEIESWILIILIICSTFSRRKWFKLIFSRLKN